MCCVCLFDLHKKNVRVAGTCWRDEMNTKCHPPPSILRIVSLLLFHPGSAAAALLNSFSFIPGPFRSTLLNDPCQQVDLSLEQNKIKCVFLVVWGSFYNRKATSLIPDCAGMWAGGQVNRFGCFSKVIFQVEWTKRFTQSSIRKTSLSWGVPVFLATRNIILLLSPSFSALYSLMVIF